MKFANVESIQSLALVGPTELAGEEFLSLLSEFKVKVRDLQLFDGAEIAGESFSVLDNDVSVEPLSERSFEGIEAVVFASGPEVTRKYAPIAARSGALIVDGSGAFRSDPSVPLIVPEINGAMLRDFSGKVLSNPSSVVTPLALCLKPLQDTYGLKRVTVSTYQAVSGAGQAAYEELSTQSINLLSGGSAHAEVFAHEIAFNCLPEVGPIGEDGCSDEEVQTAEQLRELLDNPDLKISVTSVLVPTFCGHGLSVNVELRDPLADLEMTRELLDRFPGLKVLDNPTKHIYPTNRDCIGSDPTFVGRLRRDTSLPSALNLWIMADNLRKGTALNALQILETLFKYRRMS